MNDCFQPLSDLRVLDLTQLTAGPMCTRLLADAGADVIKIEPPGGEPARRMPPLITGSDGSTEGSYFLRLAVNKRSVVLDLKTTEGREALFRLVEHSDVLVEAFRPGTMDKLGLGYPELSVRNPRLLMTSVSGFGQPDVMAGPYSNRPSYDPIVQAMSGIAHVTGDPDGPPQTVGASLADTVPGMFAAYSILLAVLQRQKDGIGRHVDVAQYDTMLWANDRNITAFTLAGANTGRGGQVAFAPYGVFPAADGDVVIAVISDRQWAGCCAAMGRPDLVSDPRTATGEARRASLSTFLGPAVTAWTSGLATAVLTEMLEAQGVPVGPVQSAADVATCPQARARAMFVEVEHPKLGSLTVLGSAVKVSGISSQEMRPPPALGEHTRDILSRVAELSTEEIDHLTNSTTPGHPDVPTDGV